MIYRRLGNGENNLSRIILSAMRLLEEREGALRLASYAWHHLSCRFCLIKEELVEMLRLLSTEDKGVKVVSPPTEAPQDALPTVTTRPLSAGEVHRKGSSLSGTV